jgi:hypothetical protein
MFGLRDYQNRIGEGKIGHLSWRPLSFGYSARASKNAALIRRGVVLVVVVILWVANS